MSAYYIVNASGQTCGHVHASINPQLARCWGTQIKAGKAVLWQVTDVGKHSRAPSEAREALAKLLPTRGRGRPAGQTPPRAQGTPLYARLTAEQRERFEAKARAAGFDDLGRWALSLMEAARVGLPLELADPCDWPRPG
jgi:hypothetical protein